MATTGKRLSSGFHVSLDGPAIADRCVCLRTPAFYSEQLLARMHVCTGRSVFNSALFGCPLHQWQLSHTVTDDEYSVFLYYQSDAFPGLAQRCVAVAVEFELRNSEGELIAKKELKRAFTSRASWGFKRLIEMEELRKNELVLKDGLLMCSTKVIGLEGAAFTDEFQAFREAKQFCDVTLVLDDGELDAHKLVLIARSDYFAGLLLQEPQQEASPQKTKIIIPETLEIMMAIIDFMYIGHCECDHSIYLNVYKAADLYGCDQLKSLLANRLASEVTMEKIVELTKLAWDHDDEVLKETLAPLLRENMSKLRERSDFRDMIDKGGYADMIIRLFEVE